LKMILAGDYVDGTARQRFRREAEAVARLRHPHIVQIHEIGEQQGQPYFSLEFVEGGSLASRLDGTPWPTERAAPLVEALARAMQAAHDEQIIHRDLKPANILLQQRSAKGVQERADEPEAARRGAVCPWWMEATPKITDFGLAKQLDTPGQQTQSGAILGTPSYMAPEQAGSKGPAVGPRSDVYALGAILYELLTGRPPFRAPTPLDTVLQVVSEEPVPPRRLQPQLARDVETICLKCLQKEPAKRYDSAHELAEDLRRCGAGEPIRARPIRVWERGFKWAKRRPALTALLAVSLLAAVSLVVGGLWYNQQLRAALEETEEQRAQAEEQRDAAQQAKVEAEAQRDRAQKAEAQAKAERNRVVAAEADTKAFSDFLVNHVLAAPRPEGLQKGIGVDVRMSEALAAAERQLERVFTGRPKAEATARHALGVTWMELGKYGEAEQQLRRALELRIHELGADAGEALSSGNSLGLTLVDAGRPAEAIRLLQQTLEKAKAKLGPDHSTTLTTMNNLALAYGASGQLDKALPLHEQTLEKRRAKLGPDHSTTLTSMNNLAEAYRATGQLDKSLSLHEQVLEKRRARYGPDHPSILPTMNNLAGVYKDIGHLGKAVLLYEQSLEIATAKLGPNHPDTLSTMNGLALAYQTAGQLDKALPLYEQTLAYEKVKLGPDHPHTLNTMNNLATTYQDTGQLERALPLFEETLEKKKAKLGTDHPDLLSTMNNLAAAYEANRQLDKALPLFELTLEKRRAKLGPDHPHTIASMNNLAGAYQASRRLDKALVLYEQTLEKARAKLGPDHPGTLNTMNNLAGAYQAAGQFDKVLPLYEQTLEKKRTKLGANHPDTLITMNNLAGAYRSANRPREAVALYEEALRLRKAVLGPDHRDTLRTLHDLGTAYVEAQRLAEAEGVLGELVERRRQREPNSINLASALVSSGICLLKAGKYAEAGVPLREALTIQEKRFPDDWRRFHTMSLLGGSAFGQQQYAAAEPLLLQGFEGMQQRAAKIPRQSRVRLAESLERLVHLYEATGQKDKAGHWRKKLEETKAAAQPRSQP
jgi:hypothetical protein